jgi:hypothetical protein
VIAYSSTPTLAFTPPQSTKSHITAQSPVRSKSARTHDVTSTKRNNLFKEDDDDEDDLDDYDYKTAAQIRKARKLLKDAKKKMEEPKTTQAAAEQSAEAPPLPFFATRSSTPSSQKIKSKTSSGIVADGATMTTISASEPWELRPLNQMFVREPRTDYDGNLVTETSDGSKSTLAEKDLAKNILSLKRLLRGEDFKVVFDSRNRFIGDIE